MTLRRRRFLAAGAAFAAGSALARPRRPHLADMHSHYGMFLPRLFALDLAQHMRETGTTLLTWAVVDDQPWIGSTANGIKQLRDPRPGELWAFFKQRMQERDAQLRRWNLARVLTPDDVRAALAGEPHVVMGSESANFLEGRPERVAEAHAMGLRHLQLVHYIQSPLGDFQTAEPRHGGLSPAGVEVVRACRKLGMLVDLAHGTPALVDAALDASDAAMVWSHSWISSNGGHWQEPGYMARSLAPATAKKIAARGGVVGLWTVRVKGDPAYPVYNVRTFADETMRMADLLGPRHIAFGTDMEGAGPGPILSNYVDLREVADNLAARGLPDEVLQGICIGNYARVLKKAMAAT